ncbi:DUF3822 family protein [Flavobacteriaceae sp. LMIT009]
METGQKTTQKSSKIEQNKDKLLSIQVSLNGLSFCILDKDINTIVFYKSFLFEKKLNPGDVLDRLTHQFNTESALKQSFKNVSVVHDNELSSLVPKPLFNEEFLADYLKFNSKILRSDYITYDQMQANDAVNVYVPYVNINNFLYDKFGEFEFKHFSTIVIENILSIEKNSIKNKMYVHLSDHHFEIVIVENGQLRLYNTFEFSTKEDFIYYILFTAEQLEMNPEEFPIEIIGNIDENNELFQITYKYVRDVSIHIPNTKLELADELEIKCLQDFVILNSF